jgi:uracil-DNA glycosylase
MADDFWARRGVPWDFDAGPPAGKRWSTLFAETPNYRALGVERTGAEAFRWHQGPMFYRGRLQSNAVKVLLVGQEGAQDESLAHRSFVGGSGARMQHFLGHIGISRSYLFLNTFVYPIFGQYDDDLKWLAQNAASPIVQHRQEIFDYVAEINDGLHLVVAIGRAAQESVRTWKRLRATPLSAKTQFIDVMHPGAAAAGSASAVVASFRAAVNRIRRWANEDPTWLPPDPGATRQFDSEYKYRSAPIPFADLPYGVNWRLGSGGTSSNRRDGQRAIQVFSSDGRYNNTGTTLAYPGVPNNDEGYEQDVGDLAYEPPRFSPRAFDPGPPAAWARLLMGGAAGFAWPDFDALGLPGHPSFGTGAIYRGRPEDASIVVLADQASHDDLFHGRALCGDAGQRLQRWLAAAGLTRRYLILRTLPVDSLGATAARVQAAVAHPGVVALYREAMQRQATAKVLVAIGPHAAVQAPRINARNLPVVALPAHGASGWAAAWQAALAPGSTLRNANYPTDQAPSFNYDGRRGQIARIDLPFGTLRWQGSSGDLAAQARIGSSRSRDYFKHSMPGWAAALDPEPL